MLPESQIRHELQGQTPPSQRSRLARLGILVLSSLALFLVSFLASPNMRVRVNALDATATGIPPSTEPVTFSAPTAKATQPPTATPTNADLPIQNRYSPKEEDLGTIFLSIDEGGYSHLFAYHPSNLPLTRLTWGAWDDVTPALSPDGARLAFASNRSGSWDLYLLVLETGTITALTDTPEYDAAPAWSPDGQYLAFETYAANPEVIATGGNSAVTAVEYSRTSLEIALMPVSGDQEPILLSEHPAADFAPAWSPLGRQIAFVSTRSGEREIWLADLDQTGEGRLTNLSNSPTSAESHPTWSPDGNSLAWAGIEDGSHGLYILDGEARSSYIGSGDWPAWSPNGKILLASLVEPNGSLLTGYSIGDDLLALPPMRFPGQITGLSWGSAVLPGELAPSLAEAARTTPQPSWSASLEQPLAEMPDGRYHLVELDEVAAPYPQLHDLVDEAFLALRERVAWEAGWDFLSSLENAFVPINSPLAPGMGEDWLYTGRAFAFSPLPINSGWVVVIPEPFGAQTYWRVYLKARYQDGSHGAPLDDPAWDFNARYTGDPLSYEGGGKLTPVIPAGYWIDFTALARAYGWERLPALSIWQTAYFAARFNEFTLTEGQSWNQAMEELYPLEALLTPTAAPPPTLTPTPTAWWKPSP